MHLFTRQLSADCDTPVSVFARLRSSDGCFLLESAEGGERWGRYSFIGIDPAETVIESDAGLTLRRRGATGEEQHPGTMTDWLRHTVIAAPPLDSDLPFTGGAVGYFCYEQVLRYESLTSRHDGSGKVLAAFMLVDRFIVFDNLRGGMTLCVRSGNEAEALATLDALQAQLDGGPRPTPLRLNLATKLATNPSAVLPQGQMTQGDYEAMVRAAKEYILAGDIFQVVLSQRFTRPFAGDPLLLYRAVRQINPSPYLFYLHINETVLVGSSPEILVRKEGSKAIVRPIAGTRPRGATAAADLAYERDLLADQKELAEHIMLVDLGRNDLGRVCQFGSVHVTDQMTIERYSHVMHIVSQVEGELRPDVDAIELLAATFPAGTVSGAPKVRAMQIIDELEPISRGPYAGAIGYLSFGGANMNTAITIRTAVIRDGVVQIQSGAGIVADSDPASEHRECVNKAMAMFRAVHLAEAQP